MKEKPELILEELSEWMKTDVEAGCKIYHAPNGFRIELDNLKEYANGYGATIAESIRCALISWYEKR